MNKESYDLCDMCHRAKQTRNPFPNSETKTQRIFSLIHCDLWGPYHTRYMSGCCYFLYVVDDFSRAIWVYLLKDKSEACDKLINFCTMVKTQFDVTV